MTAGPHPHGPDELCEAGSALYARALRENRVARADAEPLPCLAALGLLHPDADDPRWLLPAPPAVALPRLLEGIQQRIAARRLSETRLATAFEPLMELARRSVPSSAPCAITVLRELPEIQEAVSRALSGPGSGAGPGQEMLSIQPGGVQPPVILDQFLSEVRGVLARGGRLRTLYQHATRHSLPVFAYHETLDGDTEVRTLAEVPERLFVLDRTVAFIPADKDHTAALEIRHPVLIEYFVTAFERLWRLAVPLDPRSAPLPAGSGVTPRQRDIARLLVEGCTDADIAERLGMNIRTARIHIAKLAATLGSGSRAQLGYLIGRSGILGQDR
ncbi:LuxR C-terminal-related transcriptional regulator [Streptomyces sp. NPDC058308]|uniref:helix-turn-helix transcriptional regulator n=1 Tax=Streptomyces sp. NPDC058308 TaxID=3346440 RepID=UPI0036E1FE5F